MQTDYSEKELEKMEDIKKSPDRTLQEIVDILPLSLNGYQKMAEYTANYPNFRNGNIWYPTLGLCGEAGEVANKVKKIHRDDNDVITDEKKQDLILELGDCLWYIASFASELGVALEDLAKQNIKKLYLRKQKGTIHGQGDHR